MFDFGHLNILAQYLADGSADESFWLPLDPFLLLLLKFFVVFTCVFFWIKLFYDTTMRSGRIQRHRHDR